MRIVKSMSFDAAHYLEFDPQERPYGRLHGHSFLMEVEIAGDPDPETGWVVDFGDIEDALKALRDKIDHRLLNEVEGLERPTLENIAKWTAKELLPQFPELASVKISRPSNGETCIYDL